MTSNPDRVELSVVVPIFNEVECVEELHRRITQTMEALNRPYEILLVDDGSTDGTRDILRRLQKADPRLRVIFFRKNYGQTPAMVAGFDHARGEVIVTMDGDLQNDPADIGRLLDKMKEGYEVVSGWRFKRQDKLITRKIPSMCANKLISILTGVALHDYGCSLKVYKTECIRAVHAYAEMHRFFPAVASITGARTAEIPVSHYARTTGKSKYGFSRTFKVFADLFTIFMITKFSTRPTHFFGWLGLPSLFFAFAATAVACLSWMKGEEPSVIWIGTAFLFYFLFTHFAFLSALSGLILKKGKYKPGELTAITAVSF